jgi:mono/diheme cytochrome c family protein
MKKTVLIFLLALSVAARPGLAEDKIEFSAKIRPIFQQSCIKCHGPEKQKGKLRLDSKSAAFKGSENGPVIKPGKADESELYKRVTLPASNEDRMPNEGDSLSKAQTDLIRDWINQGAEWPEEIAAKDSQKKKTGIEKLAAIPAGPSEPKAIAKLESMGMSIRPVAMNMNWREANLGLQGTNVTDAVLSTLKDIPTLVNLNLRGTKVTDAGLDNLKGLNNLLQLHLENTAITDAGLARLNRLTNLNYLNLYGTAVTDSGLDQLKPLTDLQSLYLWQTKVTSNGVAKLQKALPELKISTGWELTTITNISTNTNTTKDAGAK